MHRSISRTLGAAASVAVLTGGAAVITTSSAAHAQSSGPRTLHLVEKGGGITFVDNAPKAKHPYDFSAGDIVVVNRNLYTRTGGRSGSLRLVCVATDPTTQQCNGTETLPGGTLEVAGISSPAPSTQVAVIGGTGTYAGARGTSVSQDRKVNNNIADQIIALRP